METTTATTIDDDSDDKGNTDSDGDDCDGNNGIDDYFSHNILHYYNMVPYGNIVIYCNIVWYTTYYLLKYIYNKSACGGFLSSWKSVARGA
jgi:hypothetical protein